MNTVWCQLLTCDMHSNEGRVEKNETLAVAVSESCTVVTFEPGLLV